MRPFLYAALAGYVVAAIHAVLAFVNKRRAAERIAFYSVACGFAAHTAALAADWVQDGQYPLFHLHETISFLAWTLVIAYGVVTYKYSVRALGAFLLPAAAVLVFASSLPPGPPGSSPSTRRFCSSPTPPSSSPSRRA
jgi:ABC-type transport system involved in cytochrome c biogenesis permease subunit